MNVQRKTIIATIALCSSVLFSSPAFAQVTQIEAGLKKAAGANYNTSADSATALPIMIGTIISVILETTGILLLGYLIYAGFLWMTAGGDSDKVKHAVATIRNVIIGLAIVVASYAIAGFVLSKLSAVATQGSGSGLDSQGGVDQPVNPYN